MKLLRWILCRLPRSFGKWAGHRKGKPTGQILPGMMKVYRCPRCGAEWSRKIKEQA